jgi:hypothetical protein
MIQSIARQSVVIKCNLQASIMMGNYEFYYAAGLAYKLTGNMATEILQPQQLIEEVNRMLADDVREQHLIRMLKDYEPDDKLDEQMRELFQEGQTEQRLWQE